MRQAFTSRFYRPGNMVFFVLGNMDFRQVVRWAEKLLADIPAEAVDNPSYAPAFICSEKSGFTQRYPSAHIMIGSRGYNAYEDKRTALYLLNNILGGPGMNSRAECGLARTAWVGL